MNFKTHFIFSIFAVNEQKVLLFARSAPKNTTFSAFLNNFPPKTAIFSRNLNLQNFRVFEKTQGPWEKNQALGEKTQAF